MTLATDTLDALPVGLGESAVLDRAEAEGRRMRSTFANNVALMQERLGSWNAWLEQIKIAVKGKS
jgi:hypothetical protein